MSQNKGVVEYTNPVTGETRLVPEVYMRDDVGTNVGEWDVRWCNICEEPFSCLAHLDAKYCSDPCRFEAMRRQQREKYITITCSGCGKTFETPGENKRRRKFCSKQCQLSTLPKHKNRRPLRTVQCANPECSAEFETKNQRTNYCSKSCAAKARPRKMKYNQPEQVRREFRKCERCGTSYEPTHKPQRFCSAYCGNQAKSNPANRTDRTKVCVVCHNEFRCMSRGKEFERQKTCSRSCANLMPREKICDECGSPFLGSKVAKICSDECRAQRSRKRCRTNKE